MDSQFTDQAKPILAGSPDLTDDKRAALWDIFHNTKDSAALAQHLQSADAPDDVKQQLFDAKKKMEPTAAPLDKATEALTKIANMNPVLLDQIEAHPKTASLLVNAATKEAEMAAAASQPAGKGKTQGGAKKLPPLVQPPRVDGLEHLPPIPDGHHRVLASDGGIHDVPAENIEQARAIDPRLHVLNP